LLAAFAAQSAEASDEDFSKSVLALTNDNIADFKDKSTPGLVMFYAPWCGHCKEMKPPFGKVAALAKEHDLKFGMAGVDCTSSDGTPLCAADQFNVTSYPTTLFFAGKDASPVTYEEARTLKGLKNFLKAKLGLTRFPGSETFVNEPKWEENGNVVHQTDEHFDGFRKDNPKILTMFYAPWCGHCKDFKPHFAEASRKTKGAAFVAIDCTEELEVCKTFNVSSYPTLFWYASTDAQPEEYDGSRSDANDVRSWIENKVEAEARKTIGSAKLEAKDLRKLRVRVLKKMLKERGLECKGCTDKKEFVKMVLENQGVKVKASTKKHKMTWAQEKRFKKANEVADKGWDNAPDVTHVTEHTFDSFRKEQQKSKPALVMFQAPWCGHCKELKPKFAEAATVTKGDGFMVSIECDTNPDICQKHAKNFPTLKLFADSEAEGKVYEGGRETHDLVAVFNKEKAKPLEKSAKAREAACSEAGLCF
jgi:protein disulfide-isomerase/protein disulfide isomerase family A protein 5